MLNEHILTMVEKHGKKFEDELQHMIDNFRSSWKKEISGLLEKVKEVDRTVGEQFIYINKALDENKLSKPKVEAKPKKKKTQAADDDDEDDDFL